MDDTARNPSPVPGRIRLQVIRGGSGRGSTHGATRLTGHTRDSRYFPKPQRGLLQLPKHPRRSAELGCCIGGARLDRGTANSAAGPCLEDCGDHAGSAELSLGQLERIRHALPEHSRTRNVSEVTYVWRPLSIAPRQHSRTAPRGNSAIYVPIPFAHGCTQARAGYLCSDPQRSRRAPALSLRIETCAKAANRATATISSRGLHRLQQSERTLSAQANAQDRPALA